MCGYRIFFNRNINQYFCFVTFYFLCTCPRLSEYSTLPHQWSFIVFLRCHTVGAKSLETSVVQVFMCLLSIIFGTVAKPLQHCIFRSRRTWWGLNGASSASCDFTSCWFSQQDHPVQPWVFFFCFVVVLLPSASSSVCRCWAGKLDFYQDVQWILFTTLIVCCCK